MVIFFFYDSFFDSGTITNRESTGCLETASVEFLQASMDQNLEKLKVLKPFVNVNVCDNNGLNALLIAVVSVAAASHTIDWLVFLFFWIKIKCNIKLIDYLLDNGANVNHILDNGLTGLMICVSRYYTSEKFLPNTALKHQDLVN